MTYDYGFRIYDTRIAKFLSVDPLTQKYPWYTPYQFAGNKPIWAVDLDGLEEFYTSNGQLIGKIGENDQMMLVKDKNIEKVKGYIVWNNYSKSDKYKKYSKDKAIGLSKEIIFDDSKEILAKMYSEAAGDNKERSGNFVFDESTATVSFKRSSGSGEEDHVPDLYAAGEMYHVNDDGTGSIAIANAHTHQQEDKYLGTNEKDKGIVTDQSNYDRQFGDGADGNTSLTRGTRYTIGNTNVDFFSPQGKSSSINNLTTRKNLINGNINLAKHAFKEFVKTRNK